MNDVDRRIAERLGYHVFQSKHGWYQLRDPQNEPVGEVIFETDDERFTPAIEGCWINVPLWSQDIGAALALVEALGIDCFRLGFDLVKREWQTWTLDTPEEQPHCAPIGIPAEAVARAIDAWLAARENEADK